MPIRKFTSKQSNSSAGSTFKFVLMFGFISLFADMTYEGARSITGPYLSLLGANATVVGIVAGSGELVGYGLRFLSGHITDRTSRYWGITFLGYGINLVAVPLLAFAGRWEIAAILIVSERVGKAIRTPARDAMLSHATHEMGRGRGFGIHEAMDKIGSMLGPLMIAGVLFINGSYKSAFALLFIPALLALFMLSYSRTLYPNPRDLEVRVIKLEREGFSKSFWIYLLAAGFIAAGYADFALIAYHFEKASIIPVHLIPLYYAFAMGTTALSAFIFGRAYDKVGISLLIFTSLASALFAPLVFLGNSSAALAGIGLWALGLGTQGSVMRAIVAEMVSPTRRGSAYGIFNMGFGIFWFLGSALMGLLYDRSVTALIMFSVLIQLFSIPLFVVVRRTMR
ncbi:MAG: MFS transporter [Dissulfurispiraceae bacterium]